MLTPSFSSFSSKLRIAVDDPIAEYKYVVLHGSEIQWEGGENRVVDTTRGDRECNDTWVSVGASEFIARADGGDVPEDVDAEQHEGAAETYERTSELREGDNAVYDDGESARTTAIEARAVSSRGERSSSEVEINEDIPAKENISSKTEQKCAVDQNDPNCEQQREQNSGDTKENFVETRTEKTPFLLINTIFKLCRRRRTTSAN